MDTSLRLLDRVLPPLKAVEVTDSPEKQADPTRLTTSELMKLVQRMAPAPGGPIEEAEVFDVPSWFD